jgi:hypothetical protein
VADQSNYDIPSIADQEILTSVEVSFDGVDDRKLFSDFTVREVILAESLLTPGLQTSVKAHSYLHNIPKKTFDDLKGAPIKIKVKRPILTRYNMKDELEIEQITYRLGGRSSTNPNENDNRKMINRAVEELVFHACDNSLLNDAASLVSKSWKCTTPSSIVSEILHTCVGVNTEPNVEPSMPARDYIAENIHPFQVITQQAQAALANGGNDPSFIHFMTYEDKGKHHFRSLYEMSRQKEIIDLQYSMTGSSYSTPYSIMNYTFPCDFDLLSDILNGVDRKGQNVNSLVMINPTNKLFSWLGNQARGCGMGGAVHKIAISNQNSAKDQDSCPDYVSTYLQKRQARMALLEKDKIALRLTVPWNPIFNAGKIINIKLYNTEDQSGQMLNYGSGKYLIVSLVHHIRAGGYSTITMDCVSDTAGSGEV